MKWSKLRDFGTTDRRKCEEMRESFVFYESFYLAISELSAAQQSKTFQAICRYALYEELPELKGASAAVFRLVKPQIDANNRRYENGKKGAEHGVKGGRPKNPKETPSKPLKNPKETPNVTVHVPVNVTDTVPVNGNGNVTVSVNETTTANALGSSSSGGGKFDDEFNIWKMLGGEGIDAVYETYPNTGGLLLDKVYEDIKEKKKKVNSPLAFVMGYAKKVGWSDEA